MIIGRVTCVKADALNGNSCENDELLETALTLTGAFTGHVIYASANKVIFSKKYPCIESNPFEEIVNSLDLDRIEEIASER